MSANQPFDERDLPVSIDPQTQKFISLNDLMKERIVDYVSLESLDQKTVNKLVVERIKAAPDLDLAILGKGQISKEQAIKEVEHGTSLGDEIIEIERRAIRLSLSHAKLNK